MGLLYSQHKAERKKRRKRDEETSVELAAHVVYAGVVGTAEGTVHGWQATKNGRAMVAHPCGKTSHSLYGI